MICHVAVFGGPSALNHDRRPTYGRRWAIQQKLARERLFVIVKLMLFAYKKMLGRVETRTLDRIYCQTMRTVRDISRDDRARIAICSLRTLTDGL